MRAHHQWLKKPNVFGRVLATVASLIAIGGTCTAQTLVNASFEAPAVTANSDSLRPTGATWTFSGQSGIRNNTAPNGSDSKQAAFLSAAPVSGNNNFGGVRQTVTLKPGTYYVRYLAALKTPTGRPQPVQFYVNGVAQGGVLNPRHIADTTTGGFEAGWTQPFVVTATGGYEVRFDATNATNYGTVSAPRYAVAYLDAVTVVSVPTGFADSGFEAGGAWTLSSGATTTTATDAPEGSKVLTIASAATASQSLALPAGRYSLSLKIGKASTASGTLAVEVASNGAAAVTVATISATSAAEYRAYSTVGFALSSGNHVFTLRASGSSFSVDAVALNDAGPDAGNAGFETPVLAAPSSATAAGPTVANPTTATWTFSGTGGLVQANAGSSNTSAPRTIVGKQYLALSGTGAVAQSLAFAGGTYVAVGQLAQGGLKVLIDGAQVGKLSASTLDFREVMSAPFVVTAGIRSLSLAVDTAYSPATPKLDELRLLRVDVPPAVSITAPANGAVFQTGATVDITASASDPDGISNLAISRTPTGGSATQLASSASSPLSTSWTNSSANGYTITASATDSTGATSSTAINIRVNANPSAIVSISPTGPVVTSATPVTATLTVSSASDSDGTVTKIEFLQDAVVATTCTKSIPPAVAPFTCALSLPPRAAGYALTVRVTDNDGGTTTTAALTLRINNAPTVSLTAACAAPCSAPGTVNLTATPADTDGTIAKVEFYDGATLLTTKSVSPWSYSHTTATAGSHSYTAKAFDNDNAATTSTAQTVVVTAPVPSLALATSCTAPCNAPAAVTLTAVPSNITGTISKVEFYDGTTLLNSDTTSPYSFAAASVAAATHSYTAKVYVTGTTAAVATSSAHAVRVNALPSVTLTAACVAPCAVSATVNLTASPADSDGTISKVEFYDGATLLSAVTVAPWTFTQTNAGSGAHNYTAKAFDNDLASKTSTSKSVTVAATAPPAVALTVTCDAPCEAPASLTLTARPTNIVGGTSYVQFTNAMLWIDTFGGYGNVEPDGSFSYRLTNAAAGAYSLSAVATSNSNVQTTSSAVSLNVVAPANAAPTVDWVSPQNNAEINALGTFILSVTASDADGSIASVAFYADGSLLGNGTFQNGAYRYTWPQPSGAGPFQVTAVATDNLGKTSTSTLRQLRMSSAITFDPITPPVRYINPGGTADISIPVYVAPTPQEVQGPTYQWTVANQFAPWIVELIENDVVVATQKYGYEKVLTSVGPCHFSWTDPSINWCVRSWPMPTFVVASKAIGSYRYALRITRSEGVIWQSAESTISVADPAPVVTITSPSNGSTVFEGGVDLNVTVSALTPVTYARFHEGSTEVGNCFAASGSCSFNWQRSVVGSHTVTARVTDANFLTGTSAPITFSVLANARPTVQFVSPTPYTRYRAPATVALAATAADTDGRIARVQFLDQNNLPLGNGTLTNGLYRLTVSNLSEAQNIIRAQSTDDRGALSNIESLSLRVLGAPTVNLRTRCDAVCYAGDTLIDLESNYNPDEIPRVRYLRDGTEIANLTSAPLSYVDRGGSVGLHTYRVEITSLWGEIALSAPVAIDAVAHAAPVLSITSPASGTSFANATASIPLRSVISQSAYEIVKVEFFRDGNVLLGQASMQGYATYVLNWTGFTPGSYTITARATDIAGGVGNSAPITINILGGPQAAPITSPATGSEFPAGQTVTIKTAASTDTPAPDPTITRIELWREGTGANGTDEMIASVNGNPLAQAITLLNNTSDTRLYTVAINATGSRTRSVTTMLTTRADITDPRYFVWTNLNAALKAGNKAAALGFLTPTAQANYSVALDLILPQAASIVASYSPIVLVSDSFDLADYLVARTVNGTRLVFAIRFILMDDGKWRLDGL